MRFAFLPLVVAGLVSVAAACSGKTTGEPSDGGGITSGCAVVPSVSCGGGYVAVQCLAGVSPEDPDGGISCSGGAEAGADTDYCCTSTTPPGLGCSVDGTVQCSGSGETGYTCVGGAFPIGGEGGITCNSETPNPGGTSTSYCCTP